MRRLILVALVAVAASCAKDESSRVGPGAKGGAAPGHDAFLPEHVTWADGPPSLPAGAQFAVLEGDPSRAGYFAMRVRMPDGYRIPPHWHPVVERVTVISGTLRLGMGETFEPAAFRDQPAGTYVSMPAGMRHYAAADGDTVIQIATIGPWAITYVNAADDPRRKE